jgi:regulator of protease activity HflC (stomatin/prohibitin superfamily)
MPDLATLLALVAAIIVVAFVASRFRRVTVFEYEQGLRYRAGRFVGLVGPGAYWLLAWRDQIRTVDIRVGTAIVPGQELVTADGITVKLSLAVERQIVDADAAFNRVSDWNGALYVAVQVALREVVGGLSIDDVLARRDEIGPDVTQRAAESVRALGVELRSVEVRDLMLPGPTKRLLSQVVDARQRGLAALEKARGETAALRSLANAARMVEANPSLLQLRMLQQLESSTGNTVLLGMPPSATPIPIRQVAGEPGGSSELPPAPGPSDSDSD